MDPKGNQEIIDNICVYSKERQVKDILQEYLKRLILDKPVDPVEYLIKVSCNNSLCLLVEVRCTKYFFWGKFTYSRRYSNININMSS